MRKVPSPAQAAYVSWYVPWWGSYRPVEQLALRTCGLLRLGVK